jgi:hypothetical protein
MDVARPTGRRPRRLIGAFSSPHSYGLVLLLILVTYALSATITAAWAVSLVLVVQIATVWVTLRASRARRLARVIANAILVIAGLAALVNLFIHQETAGTGLLAVLSGLLYLVAPVSIVRHLALRRMVDLKTVLGAIAAYLLVGMFFAFLYRALGALQPGMFFGSQGEGTSPRTCFSPSPRSPRPATATWCPPPTRVRASLSLRCSSGNCSW